VTVLVFLVFAILWLGHLLITKFNDNGLQLSVVMEQRSIHLLNLLSIIILPTAFFLAFDLVVPVVAAASAGSSGSPLIVLSAALSVDLPLCSLMDQAAYVVFRSRFMGLVPFLRS
jgi:hypothetical protein